MHLPLANRRHVVLAAIGTGVQDRKAASMTLEVPKNLTQFPATSSWPESERLWLQNPSIQWDECSHSVHMHCANSFAFNAISLAHRTLACTSAGAQAPFLVRIRRRSNLCYAFVCLPGSSFLKRGCAENSEKAEK